MPRGTLYLRTFGRFLTVTGIGLVILATSWDFIHSVPDNQFGPKQMFGCFVGVSLSMIGIQLCGDPTGAKWRIGRWLGALLLAGCSFAALLVWNIGAPSWAPTWILVGYVAAICLLLPIRIGAMALAVIVGLNALLGWINDVKVELTGLPITVLDIRIAILNPSGLWDALALAQWSRVVITAALTLAALWLVLGVVAGMRHLARISSTGSGNVIVRMSCIAILASIVAWHLEALNADAAKDLSTWRPDRVARLVDRMGVLPFIAYSYHLEL